MKTSNKILLTLFLLPFVIVLFMSLALYAKIKRGDFITGKQQDMENSIIKHTEPFSDIDLSHFTNGHLTIQYSDSFSIKYDKWEKDNIEYLQEGSKLMLKTKPGSDYNTATILCPSFKNLRFDSLEVEIDSMHLSNTTLNIGNNASLNFGAQADNLQVNTAKGSGINFSENAIVDTLHLQLSNGATLNKESNGIIKHLGEIQLADSASITVDGKTMRMFLEKQNAPAKP
ncbi:MAG: hypothetical protein QM802_21125 [Agriterribacter sp.]